MQSISGYLYRQTIELIIMDSGPFRENTLVYAKPLQIYKGIDNTVRLVIKNQEQKPLSLLDSLIEFNLISSDNYELVFKKTCRVTVVKGQAIVTLEEADVTNLTAGIYNYSVKLINGEGEARIVYADDNYNAQGQARVNDTVYPRFIPSMQPKLGPFYNNSPSASGYSDGAYVYSDVIDVLDRIKSRDVIQTVQYNFTEFTGQIWIQGSLSATMTAYPDDWFDIADYVYNDPLTGCFYQNFNGKIGLVRFKIRTDSGSLDKVLYRT